MDKLCNEELILVKGGASISKLMWTIIGGLVVFAIGMVDGIVSPKKCN